LPKPGVIRTLKGREILNPDFKGNKGYPLLNIFEMFKKGELINGFSCKKAK